MQVFTQLAQHIARSQEHQQPSMVNGWVTLNSICYSGASDGQQDSSLSGTAVLAGHPSDQLAITIISLLPWLCLHFRHGEHMAAAAACLQVSLPVCIPEPHRRNLCMVYPLIACTVIMAVPCLEWLTVLIGGLLPDLCLHFWHGEHGQPQHHVAW